MYGQRGRSGADRDPLMSSYSNGSGAHYLEQENDKRTDNLKEKISALKNLSLDIEGEVRSQNRLLDDMDSGFLSSQGLLGSTVRKLGIVTKSGNTKFTCYLAMFAFGVFLVIYFATSRRS